MLGFGALGEFALGEFPMDDIVRRSDVRSLVLQGLITPDQPVHEGVLIKSVSAVWSRIAGYLGRDWSLINQLNDRQWEEMIAGAYEQDGYQVVLTPRSRDFGRDIIATRSGIGSVKILGSVKAYSPGHLVTATDVRELGFAISSDRAASKGIITTTSDFAPRIGEDELIAPLLPTRLELMNGLTLQKWLQRLSSARQEQ